MFAATYFRAILSSTTAAFLSVSTATTNAIDVTVPRLTYRYTQINKQNIIFNDLWVQGVSEECYALSERST